MQFHRSALLASYYAFGRWLPSASLRYGPTGKQVRRALVAPLLQACGDDVNIERGAHFGSGRSIRLGSRSGLGIRCRLLGPITIGEDVMMGPDVLIMTGSHETADVTHPMLGQGFLPDRPVKIEDDVWIGARAIILPGVTIHRGSVIGAGSVVTRDVDPFTVVAGNPARSVKKRD